MTYRAKEIKADIDLLATINEFAADRISRELQFRQAKIKGLRKKLDLARRLIANGGMMSDGNFGCDPKDIVALSMALGIRI